MHHSEPVIWKEITGAFLETDLINSSSGPGTANDASSDLPAAALARLSSCSANFLLPSQSNSSAQCVTSNSSIPHVAFPRTSAWGARAKPRKVGTAAVSLQLGVFAQPLHHFNFWLLDPWSGGPSSSMLRMIAVECGPNNGNSEGRFW